MNRFISTGVVFMVGAAFSVAFGQTQTTIAESAREIPVAGKADVVVVGGTTAGVAAAVAAKEAGASVWLLATCATPHRESAPTPPARLVGFLGLLGQGWGS